MSDRYQSDSAEQHRRESPVKVGCAVATISDSRTLENDTSGQAVVERVESAGHQVVERTLIPDDLGAISQLVSRWADEEAIDAILLTGGTGIAARDCTPEAVAPLLTRELPGYGELLRMLSYQEIGPAAVLSRACGGLIDQTVVLTMPGSTAAVRLAMDQLVVPELAHLVSHARR